MFFTNSSIGRAVHPNILGYAPSMLKHRLWPQSVDLNAVGRHRVNRSAMGKLALTLFLSSLTFRAAFVLDMLRVSDRKVRQTSARQGEGESVQVVFNCELHYFRYDVVQLSSLNPSGAKTQATTLARQRLGTKRNRMSRAQTHLTILVPCLLVASASCPRDLYLLGRVAMRRWLSQEDAGRRIYNPTGLYGSHQDLRSLPRLVIRI
jgi:hypothetical protein